MSLWLQAAIYALSAGDYERFRVDILPHAPIPIPGCMLKEIEYAERAHLDKTRGLLFPIRFLWLLEANEQRLFGEKPLGRSRYHPETLLNLWERILADRAYRQECEENGIQVDLDEKAIRLSGGWVYIGEHFVEDLLEVERTLKVELLFPEPQGGEERPAFPEFRQAKSGTTTRKGAE